MKKEITITIKSPYFEGVIKRKDNKEVMIFLKDFYKKSPENNIIIFSAKD